MTPLNAFLSGFFSIMTPLNAVLALATGLCIGALIKWLGQRQRPWLLIGVFLFSFWAAASFLRQTAAPNLNAAVMEQCAGYFALIRAGAGEETIGAWSLAHPECLAALNAANGDTK